MEAAVIWDVIEINWIRCFLSNKKELIKERPIKKNNNNFVYFVAAGKNLYKKEKKNSEVFNFDNFLNDM